MRKVILIMMLLATGAVAEDSNGIVGQCTACHGIDGVSRWGDIPNISGLPEIVIANALFDFRGNQRPCRKPSCATAGDCPNVDMCQLSAPLTVGAMDTLARIYSERPFSPSADEFDPDLAARGKEIHDAYCEQCHTHGGSDPLDEASILRGQNMEYTRNAIADFRAGRRFGEEAMMLKMPEIDDEEAEALVQFYASPAE